MYLAVFVVSLFALIALYKKKLTIPAVILSFVLGLVIILCGSWNAFLALGLTFFLTIISDKVKKKNDDKTRNIYQIISNVFVAGFSSILYSITKSEIFYVMIFAVIGGSLADTLASSIGSLSNKLVFNPITFKEMKKGESGAVSFLGLSASICGGIIIGIVYYLEKGNIYHYLVIVLMSLVGSYVDSILGYTIQGKFKCVKCKKFVEDGIHCNKEARLIKGYSFIDNNIVNLLSNIIVFTLTFLFLI